VRHILADAWRCAARQIMWPHTNLAPDFSASRAARDATERCKVRTSRELDRIGLNLSQTVPTRPAMSQRRKSDGPAAASRGGQRPSLTQRDKRTPAGMICSAPREHMPAHSKRASPCGAVRGRVHDRTLRGGMSCGRRVRHNRRSPAPRIVALCAPCCRLRRGWLTVAWHSRSSGREAAVLEAWPRHTGFRRCNVRAHQRRATHRWRSSCAHRSVAVRALRLNQVCVTSRRGVR
jgi:hypothetical protein